MGKNLKNKIYVIVLLLILIIFVGITFIIGCKKNEDQVCDFQYSKTLDIQDDLIFASYTSLCGGDVLESGITIAETGENPIERGRAGKTKGWVNDIFVDGKYAYMANGENGLLIVNITNKQDIYTEGRVDTPGYANSIFILEDYAFVADGEEGIQVIDISDIKNPVIINSFDTSGYAFDVHVYEGLAYVADGEKGLQIIDLKSGKSLI